MLARLGEIHYLHGLPGTMLGNWFRSFLAWYSATPASGFVPTALLLSHFDPQNFQRGLSLLGLFSPDIACSTPSSPMMGAMGDMENGAGIEELKDTTTKLPNGGYGWIIVAIAVAMNAVTWGML